MAAHRMLDELFRRVEAKAMAKCSSSSFDGRAESWTSWFTERRQKRTAQQSSGASAAAAPLLLTITRFSRR